MESGERKWNHLRTWRSRTDWISALSSTRDKMSFLLRLIPRVQSHPASAVDRRKPWHWPGCKSTERCQQPRHICGDPPTIEMSLWQRVQAESIGRAPRGGRCHWDTKIHQKADLERDPRCPRGVVRIYSFFPCNSGGVLTQGKHTEVKAKLLSFLHRQKQLNLPIPCAQRQPSLYPSLVGTREDHVTFNDNAINTKSVEKHVAAPRRIIPSKPKLPNTPEPSPAMVREGMRKNVRSGGIPAISTGLLPSYHTQVTETRDPATWVHQPKVSFVPTIFPALHTLYSYVMAYITL